MHTNVCDVFCTLQLHFDPPGLHFIVFFKKTYVLGFAFYSPIPKHPPCIFIVFFAFLCREPAMHPTGALVYYCTNIIYRNNLFFDALSNSLTAGDSVLSTVVRRASLRSRRRGQRPVRGGV